MATLAVETLFTGSHEITGPSNVKHVPAVPTTPETVSASGYDPSVRATAAPCRQATDELLNHEVVAQAELPTRPGADASETAKFSPDIVTDDDQQGGTFTLCTALSTGESYVITPTDADVPTTPETLRLSAPPAPLPAGAVHRT